MIKLCELAFKLQEISNYTKEIVFWWKACKPNKEENKLISYIAREMLIISELDPWDDYKKIISKINEINLKAETLRRITDNKGLKDMLEVFVTNIKVVGHGSIQNRRTKNAINH